MNDKLYFWHADEHRSLLQVDTIIWVCATRLLQVIQNKFAHICNISRKAGGGIKLTFCLQVTVPPDSATLGVPSQVCPKCSEEQV